MKRIRLLSLFLLLMVWAALTVTAYAEPETNGEGDPNEVVSIDYEIDYMGAPDGVEVDMHPFEHVSGYWEPNRNGYFRYQYSFFQEGADKLTVTYANNETVVYTYGEEAYYYPPEGVDREPIFIDEVTRIDSQDEVHWGPGLENKMTVVYKGVSCDCFVDIIASDVSSLEYIPASPFVFEEAKPTEVQKHYYYIEPNIGDKLIVYFKDESTKTYVFQEEEREFINSEDENDYARQEGNYFWFDGDYPQDEKAWTLGTDNYFRVCFRGAEVEVPVEIIPNSIESLEYTPAVQTSYIFRENGEDTQKEVEIIDPESGEEQYSTMENYFLYYLPAFNDGDLLKIKRYNGDTTEYRYDAEQESFISSGKEPIPEYAFEIESDQYYNHWEIGGANNYYYIKYNEVASNKVGVTVSPPGMSGGEQSCTHEYNLFSSHSPSCTSKGFKKYVCKLCGGESIVELAMLNHSGVVTKDEVKPTCTSKGKTEEIKCSKCDKLIEAQKEIPALGHNYKVSKKGKAATCTASGLTDEIKCERCGHIKQNQTNIAALGHSSVADKAVAATCKAAGKTAGSHCGRCKQVLTAQKSIPKLTTHTWGAWKETVAPTVFKVGEKKKTCSVCGDKAAMCVKKLSPKLSVSKTSVTLLKGKYAGESTTVKASDLAKGDSVSGWSSSNKNIATVNGSGKITAVKAGTATVTCKTKAGASKKIKVTVKKSNKKTSSLKAKVAGKTITGKKGKRKVTAPCDGTITLKMGKNAKITPVYAPAITSEAVSYSIDGSAGYVSVSKTGVITAKKNTITKGFRGGTGVVVVKSGNYTVRIRVNTTV